jgi:hypothetical protein
MARPRVSATSEVAMIRMLLSTTKSSSAAACGGFCARNRFAKYRLPDGRRVQKMLGPAVTDGTDRVDH